MSDAEPIVFQKDGGVARIRFNRPQVLNALDERMILAFADAVSQVAEDESVRVVVLSGEGRGFLAGGDVGRFHAAGAEAPSVVNAIIGPFHRAMAALTTLRAPVVAALHGPVAGAGLSVALAADLAIASEDAKFTLAYSRIATSPDGGASWSLPRVVGLRRAMEMALLSDVIDAQEALRVGLVNKVVPLSQLADEVDALVARLAVGPTHAYGKIKALLRGSLQRSLPEQLEEERLSFLSCAGTADFAEGAAAFVQKRAGVFTGQ